MVEEGGDTISSFDTGYHVMSLWQYNLWSIKVVLPRAHHTISSIEGGDSVLMGDEVLHFLGCIARKTAESKMTFECIYVQRT